MQTYFETLVDEALEQVVKALLAVSIGDSHKHAELVGLHKGLTQSLAIYRKAARTDIEEAA